MRKLDELIIKLKSKIGVDLLGVVEAIPMEKVYEDLILNKEKNFSTKFESDDTNSRIDPSMHLENARSIFVIGMSYYWDEEEEGKFKISNHAQGRDYHKVLREKLEALKLELSEIYEFQSYIQVDSGDLFEKELGRRAGFGYIGKNTLLINNELGSYIFLGILVTDIEMNEYSIKSSGSCGECNICKNTCPSGSIIGDYTLNGSVCHSYLTQWKVEIPESKKINYAYGCDICQKICPKNRDIKKNLHLDFQPRIKNFDNIDIKNMSNKEFKRKYYEHSFSWVGKKVIARNIKLIEERG